MVRVVRTKVEMEGRTHEETVVVEGEEPQPLAEADLTHIGRATPRVDGVERVTGGARFTSDVRLPGMLYGAIARCPHAHARLIRVDVSAARALPGVRAVLTHETTAMPWHGKASAIFPIELRHEGVEIAAVAADDPDTAARAVRRITAEYEVLPPLLDPEAALRPDAPQVRPDGNVLKNDDGEPGERYSRGDVDAGFREADVIVESRYTTPAQMHNSLETHGGVVAWEGPDLLVYESTQSIFTVRDMMADRFGLQRSQVRVIKNYIGGAFGSKFGLFKQTAIAALLARAAGRPVQLMLDRTAENLVAGHRAPSIQHIKIGARRDGTLTAIEHRVVCQVGAYGTWAPAVTGPAKELYQVPNVRVEVFGAHTNTGSQAAFRAPGYLEGMVALDGAMDELAAKLNMDPLALRLHNYAPLDQTTGNEYTAKHLRECYARGAQRFGWEATRAALAAERAAGPPADAVRRGIGMASQLWGGGGGPPVQAQCRITPDGSIDVACGTQDLGTGTRTVLAQIAADALGFPIEKVRVHLGDTNEPYAPPSGGSMTVASAGPAVRMAADEARKQLLDVASAFMDTSPDRLEIRDGQIRRIGHEGEQMAVADVLEQIGDYQITGKGFRGPNPPQPIATWGAQFVEVAVDTVTGQVRVLRTTGVYDTGRVINPLTYTSQIHGGVIQGMGLALTEQRILDPQTGKSLNPNLGDYKIPVLPDVPEIEADWIGEPDFGANHLGAKGIGEPPIIPTPAAIANAVADALGVRIYDLPITPQRVLNTLVGGPDGAV